MTFCPAGCLLAWGVSGVTDVGCPLGLCVVGRWVGGAAAPLFPPVSPGTESDVTDIQIPPQPAVAALTSQARPPTVIEGTLPSSTRDGESPNLLC